MVKYWLISFLLIFVQTASAHSPLTSLIPKNGAILDRSPQRIEMSFEAPVKLIKLEMQKLTSDVANSSVSSFFSNVEAAAILLGEGFLMNKSDQHSIDLPSLDNGTYQVKWRALGEDGHVIKGIFSFKVMGK